MATDTVSSHISGLTVRGQYVKDLSFENPRAPHSLIATQAAPAIEANVDLKAQKIQPELYEMTLRITARAVVDGVTLFLVDLEYAGIFHLAGIPEEQTRPVLMVQCPTLLFPFARRVVADATRDGGFPPLMLDPIDFQTLYTQNEAKNAAPAVA